MTSEFVFFSSNPSLNHIKIEKCLLLIATNTNIFTPLFNELKTDGKSFIFAVCRLTYDHVTSNLISLVPRWLEWRRLPSLTVEILCDEMESDRKCLNHPHAQTFDRCEATVIKERYGRVSHQEMILTRANWFHTTSYSRS